jgi:hypothetical protein
MDRNALYVLYSNITCDYQCDPIGGVSIREPSR